MSLSTLSKHVGFQSHFRVKKQDGSMEPVSFDKILRKIESLCWGLNPKYVDPVEIASKVCSGVVDGITTQELDTLASETAVALVQKHPDYGLLAGRIRMSRLHKTVPKTFSDAIEVLYRYFDPRTDEPASQIADNIYEFVQRFKTELNEAIIWDNDYTYDYFACKTLEYSYLRKANKQIVETPQYFLMRVVVGIHGGLYDVEKTTEEEAQELLRKTFKTYHVKSAKFYVHATPTLFNSGTPVPQDSSCFLLTMFSDSIEGIYDTLKSCAMISKQAGKL